MEQAIHTNTIAHFLMHHMAHGENNLKLLTTPTQCGYIAYYTGLSGEFTGSSIG